MSNATERSVVRAVINVMNVWFVMLAIGGLHTAYPSIPTVSFWSVFLADMVLSGVIMSAAITVQGVKGWDE